MSKILINTILAEYNKRNNKQLTIYITYNVYFFKSLWLGLFTFTLTYLQVPIYVFVLKNSVANLAAIFNYAYNSNFEKWFFAK